MDNKIVIGICDDEEFFVEQIRRCCKDYLEEISDNYEIKVMHSGEEVLAYNGDTIELLFLDIELGGIDGIGVMNEILRSPHVWRIVFVSSHEELVWDTFSIKTMGFCRKPVQEKDIRKYINCALSDLKEDAVIRFNKYDVDTYVMLSDLYYIEGRESYVEVYAKDRCFIVTGKIGDWEKKLNDMPFIRVHKSFMVNMQHIRMESAVIQIPDLDREIPVGRTYKSKVQEKYTQFVWERMRNRS